MRDDQNKLGVWSLTGMVIGSLLGAGLFALPRQLASVSGGIALLIAWGITAVGIGCLTVVFQSLGRPHSAGWNGIQHRFKLQLGPGLGALAAWGYWCAAWVGNMAYLRVVVEALSLTFPSLGMNTPWGALLAASAILWGLHSLARSGAAAVARWNFLFTALKLVLIMGGVATFLWAFSYAQFLENLWGPLSENPPFPGIHVSLLSQIKGALLTTAWLFVGFEGALLLAAYAKDAHTVQRATWSGLFYSGLVYVLVSVSVFGVLPIRTLAQLPEATSLAAVIQAVVGPWAGWIGTLGIATFVLGSLMPWTLYAAELPHQAARAGLFPAWFSGQSEEPVPSNGLLANTLLIQIFLGLSYVLGTGYALLAQVATMMMLPSYAAAAWIYLSRGSESRKLSAQWIGGFAGFYVLWLLCSGDLALYSYASLLFGLGATLLWKTIF